jgi:cysteine-rich repeat protein
MLPALAALQVWLMIVLTSACTSPRSGADRAANRGSRSMSDRASDASTDALDATGIDTSRADPFEPPAEDDAGSDTSEAGSCGDGRVSGDERCDTAIAQGETGACPTRCERNEDACEMRALRGEACDAHCEMEKITARRAGDGCCPDGANATDDGDCAAICGNHVTEPGETCDPAESCSSCPAGSACLKVETRGSASECTAACETTMITACKPNDGCCPGGCNPENDGDCSRRCGDGVVNTDAGETCETDGPNRCPTDCKDADPCTDDVRTGSEANCNVVCVHAPITRPYNSDGCCYTGSNANSDSDCRPVCGNGVVEDGEGCDDGNAGAGDGCDPSCVREGAQQQCVASLRANDACGRCLCDHCRSDFLNCRENGARDAMRCSAVASCIERSSCDEIECYCGSNLLTCLLGDASGPCVDEIETATGANDAVSIVAELSDGSSAAGRSFSLRSCRRNQCEDECGQ